MGSWKTFEEIVVWQLSRIFCQDIFKIIQNTELKKDFALRDQLNRSSGSIMDNIAEGFGRDGNKEFRQFISIAKASADESRSQLYRVFDRNYIDESEFLDLKSKSNEISNKIGGLLSYLRKSEFKGLKYK